MFSSGRDDDGGDADGNGADGNGADEPVRGLAGTDDLVETRRTEAP